MFEHSKLRRLQAKNQVVGEKANNGIYASEEQHAMKLLVQESYKVHQLLQLNDFNSAEQI